MARIAAVLLLGCNHSRADEAAPLTVTIVGDSTVCDYPNSNPRGGWGTPIKAYFPPNMRVLNRAIDGQSTKTFLGQGHWSTALAEKPDIILVGLGRNDSIPPPDPRGTNLKTEFPANLRKFIKTAKAQGATVIFVTPLHNRGFGRDGKLAGDKVSDYVTAMKNVAKECNAPVIDLFSASARILEQLGDAGSCDFASEPGETIHYNKLGAAQWASTVAKQLTAADSRLSGIAR